MFFPVLRSPERTNSRAETVLRASRLILFAFFPRCGPLPARNGFPVARQTFHRLSSGTFVYSYYLRADTFIRFTRFRMPSFSRCLALVYSFFFFFSISVVDVGTLVDSVNFFFFLHRLVLTRSPLRVGGGPVDGTNARAASSRSVLLWFSERSRLSLRVFASRFLQHRCAFV